MGRDEDEMAEVLEARLESAIVEFTRTMGRAPTLEEEASLWERLTMPELYVSAARDAADV